jgi:hypothetical protein
MTKHSPTPWARGYKSYGMVEINDSDGGFVMNIVDDEDLPFLLEAVNSHDALKQERDELRGLLARALPYIKTCRELVPREAVGIHKSVDEITAQAKQLLEVKE